MPIVMRKKNVAVSEKISMNRDMQEGQFLDVLEQLVVTNGCRLIGDST